MNRYVFVFVILNGLLACSPKKQNINLDKSDNSLSEEINTDISKDVSNNKEKIVIDVPAEDEVSVVEPPIPLPPVLPVPLEPGFLPIDSNHDDDEDEQRRAWFLDWNQFTIDTSGIDHTPAAIIAVWGFSPNYFDSVNDLTLSTQEVGYGEQLGPTRSSRAMAIVHIAMFEAINAIEQKYESYTNLSPWLEKVSIRAAIAQAAHDSLLALYPLQSNRFEDKLNQQLSQIKDSTAKTNGILLGSMAAQSILNLRDNDGSDQDEPIVGIDYIPDNNPGTWRPDPISNSTKAIGAYWSNVSPFILQAADQFRIPTPPLLTSSDYTTAFNETKSVGGDGVITSTIRTEEQTQIGIFWAYDGTPSLCAPPRLYNQVIRKIAAQKNTNFIDTAHLLTLSNVAMADAAIAIWESKYFYKFWRPVTAIREADPGTGPSTLGDGNHDTVGDITFSPLGAPASNLNGPNFTPPFPAYPSGHAGFGGTIFQILRRFYEQDNIKFSFTSDEFNGTTKDNDGNIRPVVIRKFNSLSQAEEENGQSRMYLGIHWSFDKTTGIAQGRNVADYIFDNLYEKIDN